MNTGHLSTRAHVENTLNYGEQMHMRLPDKGKSDDTIPYSPLFVRNSAKITGTTKTTTGQTRLVFSRVNAYEQRHDGGGLRRTKMGTGNACKHRDRAEMFER